MITLKQLAELSGLSVRTVGRVLSGHPYVASEKRELVLKLARQYQYTPNMAARNLRLQRKNFIGVLFESSMRGADTRLLNMLSRELADNGFWPLLGYVESPEKCHQMFSEWAGITDYVVILHEQRKDVLEQIISESALLPLKFIYADCALSAGDYVLSIDRPNGVKSMVNMLAQNNFKHLLYCGSLESRRRGIWLAEKENLPLKITQIRSAYEFEDGLNLGAEIMRSGADAVFFDTDRMAMGFYSYAQKNNVRIPDDISVVGFNDELFTQLVSPQLATLAHPRQQTIECIMDILHSGKKVCKRSLPMQFICRNSVKAVRLPGQAN